MVGRESSRPVLLGPLDFPQPGNSWSLLLRKRFAVLFRPGAIVLHRLQWRATLRTAGTGPLCPGFGHASTGFCVQAGTDVNHIVLVFRFALRSGWTHRLILRAARRGEEGQQQ